MSLKETIAGFKSYDKIVVTGPQRSGTKIATKIIAEELGWEYVGEGVFWKDEPRHDHDLKYRRWVANEDNVQKVLHCPAISHACHLTPRGTLIVFMIRPPAEIIASDEHRMSKFRRRWITAPVNSVFKTKKLTYSKHFYPDRDIKSEEVPNVIYEVWDTIQKKYDFDFVELKYEDLEQHSLWVPLEVRRTQFTSGTQTEL
jgi:hypothetical protein